MKDRLGLAFFGFAAAVSALAAWERPTILAWLAALHNALLALLYARRLPAQCYDRKGLLLGLAAALLPMVVPYPQDVPALNVAVGFLAYGLILWALLSLGKSFGIAPADRGLVTHGPYRFVRHPVYLGELLLRAALIVGSPQPFAGFAALLALAALQALRISREERILASYGDYASRVRYRLFPGVW